MAGDHQKATLKAPPNAELVPEKHTEKKPAAPLAEKESASPDLEAKVSEEALPVKKVEEEKGIEINQSVSFKEESNVVSELPDHQRKALEELKLLIQEALNKHEFTTLPPAKEEKPKVKDEEKHTEKSKEEEKDKSDVPSAADPVEAAEVGEKHADEPKKVFEKVEVEVAAPLPSESKEVQKHAVVSSEDDGARTIVAIEESVVAVSGEVPSTPEKAPLAETKVVADVEEPPSPPEEVSIWGIPILSDDRSDVILLKFLRARDFKVKDAFTMIKNTVRWRQEFGIDKLLEEDLGKDLDNVVFMHGFDKEGHPVCYNVYGEFQNKQLYQNTFADEEKRSKFLRWRIQHLEKSIRKLDFSPEGVCTIVQVNDLKNSPGLIKWELRQATKQSLHLLQDNYPEFVAKQVFINVPWWHLAFYKMIIPFLTQRSKSKFVFAAPSRSADALLKYITPENVPVQYGGLSREGEQEFTSADAAIEITIKPATKQTVEFPVSEACLLVWELRVVGWDVIHGAEFVPSAEDGYTVIIQKSRRIAPTEDAIIGNTFKVVESGKIVLTIDNQTSKKKKLLYRSKTKSQSG